MTVFGNFLAYLRHFDPENPKIEKNTYFSKSTGIFWYILGKIISPGANMEPQYFFHIGGHQTGPVSEDVSYRGELSKHYGILKNSTIF